MLLGKTLYVLGAGCSYPTGVPLLGNFLLTSRHLLNSSAELVDKVSFQKSFEWLSKLRGSSYYVNFDLDNLEHVFSLAEIGKSIRKVEFDEYFRMLKWIILETIESTCDFSVKNGTIAPPRIYSSFHEQYLSNNLKRLELAGRTKTLTDYDPIITLNYDYALDFTFDHHHHNSIDYCMNENRSGIPFMKLHGSCHWSTCANTDCESNKAIEPKSLRRLGPLSPGVEKAKIILGRHFRDSPCKHCGKCMIEPFLVPPTWSKQIPNANLSSVWSRALECISECERIVVVGYSLPDTDTFMNYLLTLGLNENSTLRDVYVVNPDNSDEFKARYCRLFSEFMRRRNRLIFIPLGFEEYVKKIMSRISDVDDLPELVRFVG